MKNSDDFSRDVKSFVARVFGDSEAEIWDLLDMVSDDETFPIRISGRDIKFIALIRRQIAREDAEDAARRREMRADADDWRRKRLGIQD